MDDSAQVFVPPSFIAVHTPPGRTRPSLSREELVGRHDHCEDFAQALVETCRNLAWRDGLPEDIVLERVGRGLDEGAGELLPGESTWVLRRTAELLGWDDPRP